MDWTHWFLIFLVLAFVALALYVIYKVKQDKINDLIGKIDSVWNEEAKQAKTNQLKVFLAEANTQGRDEERDLCEKEIDELRRQAAMARDALLRQAKEQYAANEQCSNPEIKKQLLEQATLISNLRSKVEKLTGQQGQGKQSESSIPLLSALGLV